MKLICDCGEELTFIQDNDSYSEEDGFYAVAKGNFNFEADMDYLFIV